MSVTSYQPTYQITMIFVITTSIATNLTSNILAVSEMTNIRNEGH